MSYSTGLMETRASWTLGCDYWKTFLEGVTGIVCTSDTGSDNTRVLLFSLRGTNCLLRLTYGSSGYGYVYVVKSDGATIVVSLGRIYYSVQMVYHKINNTNVSFIHFRNAAYTGYYNTILLLKTGSAYKVVCGVPGTNIGGLYYTLHSTDGTMFGYASYDIYARSAAKTTTSKQILFPWYPLADSFTQIEDSPAVDLYSFANVDSIAAYSVVSVGASEFLVIPTNQYNYLLCKISD